jgi:hypothetical protein
MTEQENLLNDESFKTTSTESNLKDKSVNENTQEHQTEESDNKYQALNMDLLVLEFEKLLKSEPIHTIKKKVDSIKSEFNSKLQDLLTEKKEEFLTEGGNEIDFHFDVPLKRQFNNLFKDFRNNLNAHYKQLEQNQKANLEKKNIVIEKLKELVDNHQEDSRQVYNKFKEIQAEWKSIGKIPSEKYNITWNTYYHHVDRFYEYLDLNRELRDLDFKHNLDAKLKVILKAEKLIEAKDSLASFKELQKLHKIWKEDIGPVAKEYKDEIWEKFSELSKQIHEKKDLYLEELEKVYKKNLVVKNEIISKLEEIAQFESDAHKFWQSKVKEVETLRQEFFNAGKVPLKLADETWGKFKESVKAFNTKKNKFYKSIKREQTENLKRKLELIKVAEDNKNSDDFAAVTVLMKKIQNDWKKTGHVPRKDSDKVWDQFKAACNHYFDRLNEVKESGTKEQQESFSKKEAFLKELDNLILSENQNEALEVLNTKTSEWESLGNVVRNKQQIETDFNTKINSFYEKLNIDKAELDMIKFENKLKSLVSQENEHEIIREKNDIRKKLDTFKSEINQLENNLQFFSNVKKENPLVAEVHKNIEKLNMELKVWKTKFNKIKSL